MIMFCVFGGLLSGLLITESVVVINNTDLLGHKNENWSTLLAFYMLVVCMFRKLYVISAPLSSTLVSSLQQ